MDSMNDQRLDTGTLANGHAQLARVVVDRLVKRGPDCLSQLAVELAVSNKLLLQVMEELQRAGVVEKRQSAGESGGKYDSRWGLRTSLRRGEHRWGWSINKILRSLASTRDASPRPSQHR
jgi:hypothetical protein